MEKMTNEILKQEIQTLSCPCNPKCSMKRTVELIGGKWKLQIICSLSINGTSRYSELKRALPGITNTMLSNSLKELESDHLVVRNQYNEMPVRVEYSISPQTEKLLPILVELGQWAMSLETDGGMCMRPESAGVS